MKINNYNQVLNESEDFDCNHFEDDDRFALFVPLREATPDEIKNELNKVETKKSG